MKKITTTIVLLLILSFVLVSFPEIGIVKAQGTIYIRADGSVEGTDKIQRDGNNYTFTSNIIGEIVLEKSEITINGNGFTLTGDGDNHGFYLANINNSRIINVRIENCNNGYYISSCSNINITGTTITGNNVSIYVDESQNILITENDVLGNDDGWNGYGIYIVSSNNNIVSNNIIDSNYVGNFIQYSSNNLITENNVTNNQQTGIHSTSSENDIISNNIVRNNEEHGIKLELNPKDYYVSGNEITNNGLNGVHIEWTSNTTITENQIENNGKNGISVYESRNNTISRNSIDENNATGIYLTTYSYNNVIFLNNITSNSVYGINNYQHSTLNLIYHNNFIDNGNQATSYTGETNTWDNGFPSGGNYWNDYDGEDNNEDGIGDTPYIINENNQDNYPLMAPIKSFDAGTWEWTSYNVDIISNSTVSDFSFNPESALVRFNVTGEAGTTGFCRVTIPKDLLHTEDEWTVMINDKPVTPTVNEDANSSYLYFTYEHNTKTIKIIGTTAIPEFPSWIILPLFMVATLLTVIVYKRLSKKAGKP